MPVSINGNGAISGLVITTADLSDSSVTTAKIAADAVATVDIADSAVTTAKIANANVTVAKISATGTPSSTTFLRGDGAWQTTTPTTDQVLTATAGATAGAVGTYGFMNQTNTNRYTQGTTLAGSSLRFTDTAGGNSASGATASGTWRCMGTTDPFNTGVYNTLWLRIS